MAVPKYRTSKSEKGLRRSHHALKKPGMSVCPNCNNVRKPHTVCPSCGQYKGKQVYTPQSMVSNLTDQDITAG